MPCTQDAYLHFTESNDNHSNRKRSRETAYQRHDTANRGTVQSIRADGRYFTNPTGIDFSHLISISFLQKSLWIRSVRKVFTVSFEKLSWQYSSEKDPFLRKQDRWEHTLCERSGRSVSRSGKDVKRVFFLMEIEGRLQIVLRLAGKPEENVPKTPCPFKHFGILGRDVTEYDHRRDEHLQFIAGVSLLFGQFSLFRTGCPVCMALLHIVIIGICNSLMET